MCFLLSFRLGHKNQTKFIISFTRYQPILSVAHSSSDTTKYLYLTDEKFAIWIHSEQKLLREINSSILWLVPGKHVTNDFDLIVTERKNYFCSGNLQPFQCFRQHRKTLTPKGCEGGSKKKQFKPTEKQHNFHELIVKTCGWSKFETVELRFLYHSHQITLFLSQSSYGIFNSYESDHIFVELSVQKYILKEKPF